MTDIGKLCEKLYRKIEWQKMPLSMTTEEKQQMLIAAVVSGIEDLFVITGRALTYYDYQYTSDEETGVISEFSYDLMLDEELYVLCRAQIEVFSKVRTQYSDLLGYTTNALTVTNADKPYSYMTGTINELENQLRVYYYKMVRYSHLG